eukprot:4427008-Pleurochrysis_carterae.AAC.1
MPRRKARSRAAGCRSLRSWRWARTRRSRRTWSTPTWSSSAKRRGPYGPSCWAAPSGGWCRPTSCPSTTI